MRAAVKFLVLATLVIALAWWVARLPGTVGAQLGDTSISAPTSLAVLAAVVLFLVLYVVIRLVGAVLRLPRRSHRLRRERLRRRGEAAMTRTLVALAGGDAAAAQREAQRSRDLLGDTPQTLLFAAYAGRQAGRPEEEEAAFRLLADRKDAAFLGLRGLLQQALARGDLDRAAELTRQAEAANPNTAWLRGERATLALRAGQWKEALALSSDAGMQASLAAAAAEAEPRSSEGRRLAKRAWDADPGFAPAALAYARRLREATRESDAQGVLRQAWARQPTPDLAAMSLAHDRDAVGRLRRAEWLAGAAPDHPESQLLLARENLAAGQAGKALQHARAANAGGLNEQRLWVLASEIARATGDRAAETEALHRAAGAEPDTVWRCDQCGAPQATWRPVCTTCGTAGRIGWAQGRSEVDGSTRHVLPAAGGAPILP